MSRGVGGETWLVSPRFDLAIFLLPAMVALSLAALGDQLAPNGETPVPWWLVLIVFVDVAHVWSTVYRTYLDRAELTRRPGLYLGAPLAAYAVGVGLYLHGPLTFWRALAYLAVWHFVRQQYGWVALYNRRGALQEPHDRWLDTLVIYVGTLFPIAWWHAHLPRRFEWFMAGDFIPGLITTAAVEALLPVYAGVLAVWCARQLWIGIRERRWAYGKLVVVLTTWACWGYGIIATNADWAFTVTNVLIHGVPYVAILWVFGRRGTYPAQSFLGWIFGGARVAPFLLLVAALAYAEEYGWDRLVWHEHGAVFPGPSFEIAAQGLAFVVPLLAVPQATHYILDAFIWKTRADKNPSLATTMQLS